MKNHNNSSYHIDKSIIYLFIFTILSSLATIAFKYQKYVPCNGVDFSVKAKEFRQGELIRFFGKSKDAVDWKWEFGDGTDISVIKNALHVFKKAGKYTVKLTVNNICEREEVVIIKKKKDLIDPNRIPKIDIPESVIVGQEIIFNDKTPNATTWEWRFGETASVNSKKRYTKYVYDTPGLKTVSLIVNGDLKHISKKSINVLPKQTKTTVINPIKKKKGIDWGIKDEPTVKNDKLNQAKPVTAPYISKALFSKKLLLISKNQMSPKQLSKYLCGDINKKIIVNGKNTTFLVFCAKIKGARIKIKDLTIFRTEGSNCINTITIDYKKKGLWHILE